MKIKCHKMLPSAIKNTLVFTSFQICLLLQAQTLPALLSETTDIPLEIKAEMDRELFIAGEAQTAILKVRIIPKEYDDPDREHLPVNLAIVLDRSGSMDGEKIRQAKNAAIEAVKRLSKNDIFSLITYSDRTQVIIPATRISDKESAIELIENIHASGGTALYSGVQKGGSELKKFNDDEFVNRVILLSDGLANVGPSHISDFRSLGSKLARKGISVSTIGLGLGYNEDMMLSLAHSSEGNAYFAENSRDLKSIFDSELNETTHVIAKDCRLEMRFTEGVTPIRFIGKKGHIDGNTANVDYQQIYGSHEKYVMLEIRIPAGQLDETRELVESIIEYNDPIHGRTSQHSTRVSIAYTENKEAVVGSVNEAVADQWADNLLAEANAIAVAKTDMGDAFGAIKELEAVRSEIRKRNYIYHSPSLEDKDVELSDEVEYIEKNKKYDNRSRKARLTGSYQVLNQQSAESKKK